MIGTMRAYPSILGLIRSHRSPGGRILVGPVVYAPEGPDPCRHIIHVLWISGLGSRVGIEQMHTAGNGSLS